MVVMRITLYMIDVNIPKLIMEKIVFSSAALPLWTTFRVALFSIYDIVLYILISHGTNFIVYIINNLSRLLLFPRIIRRVA